MSCGVLAAAMACAQGNNPRVGVPEEGLSQSQKSKLSSNAAKDPSSENDLSGASVAGNTNVTLGDSPPADDGQQVAVVSKFPPEISVGNALITGTMNAIKIPVGIRIKESGALLGSMTQAADFGNYGQFYASPLQIKSGFGTVFQSETLIPLPQGLPNGQYHGEIEVIDSKGNKSQKSFVITLNRSSYSSGVY